MAQDDDQFELKLGRMRTSKGRSSARSLQPQIIGRIGRAGGDVRRINVKTASRKPSGRFNPRGRGARLGPRFGGPSGWSVDRTSGMRVRARRVMVKARVVKLAGAKAAGAAAAHVRYLQRDGVTREGEQGRFYSTFSDDVDGKAFLERGAGDRHQFRFIVSPEDGASFDTLKSFTRELVAKMEQDLGTTLDWVAVDHFDTGHPHTHLLVRGATEDGKTLNIAGDYIARGIRGRGSELMTRWLGPQSELEVRDQLAREIDAERLTRLDRDLLARAKDHDGYGGEVRQAMVRRQQLLMEQGLAEQRGDQVLYRSDMDQRLRRAELRAAAARLSKELGLDFSGEPVAGERISGVVRRRMNLNSGSFAVVENTREFTLVPWRPVLERQLGREISGIMRSSGSISWTVGRQRQGPEIGM